MSFFEMSVDMSPKAASQYMAKEVVKQVCRRKTWERK